MQVVYVEKPKGFETRMRIVNAITKPIRELSVMEICETAGVSRQTFYDYFESKYSVARWYALHCDTFTLDEIGRSLSWREGYEGWYSLMSQQKLLFENSAKQNYSDESAAFVAVQRLTAFEVSIERRGFVFSEDLRYFAWICACMERSAFTRWLREGCVVEPWEMAWLTESCVPPVLYRVLC